MIHPSKFTVARLGYLRGADLASSKPSGNGQRSRRSRRQSSIAAGISRRRRSTLGVSGAGGKTGRRRSSAAPAIVKPSADERRRGSMKGRQPAGRGRGVGDAIQVSLYLI